MKNNRLIANIIYFVLPFVLVVLFSGIFISIVLGLVLNEFSYELLRVSVINSMIFALGVIINILILMLVLKSVTPVKAILISIFITVGLVIVDFVLLIINEPFFFFVYKNVVYLYLIINFVFVLTISFVMTLFLTLMNIITEKEIEALEERRLRTETELDTLTRTLNPHFLFNALNSVISLLDDRNMAEKVLTDLSELLRENLSLSDKKMHSINDELDYVRKYLEIQKVRFEERLHYTIQGSSSYEIPPMILQTLVENSVKHNINRPGTLSIFVLVETGSGDVTIRIADSYRALTSDMVGRGFGLVSTKKRVELTGGSFAINDGEVVIKYHV